MIGIDAISRRLTGWELRPHIAHWLWNRYHTRRQVKLRDSFDAALISDEAFLASLRWLDEYGRMDLFESIEYRIRRSLNAAEVDRLKQSRDLLIPRL